MTSHITKANDSLLAEIEVWLDAEEAVFKRALEDWEVDYKGDQPVRGFRCNWNSTKKGWRDGRSEIYVLINDGKAVGSSMAPISSKSSQIFEEEVTGESLQNSLSRQPVNRNDP